MFRFIKQFRIFLIALASAIVIVVLKYWVHTLGLEPVAESSLHNGVMASVTFVMGFLMSATIMDYKESERMPADFAANIQDMDNDATSIHEVHPVFDLKGFRKQLKKIAQGFGKDIRTDDYDASKHIRALGPFFAAMEKGDVPPNFIVKLKQQQTALLKTRHRVNYIQKIRFIPSAAILAKSIVAALILLLLFTDIDPFYGGLAIIGIITFVLVYILILIDVISTPFHDAGETFDDVSLFLVKEAIESLDRKTK